MRNLILYAVGYENISGRQQFNYYTPMFRVVGGQVNEDGIRIMDIQDIQLDDSAGNFVNNLQLIKSDGTSAAYYVWANKATAKGMKITDGSKGAWIGQDKKPLPSPVILKEGDGVQLDLMNAGTEIKNAGEVVDDDIVYVSRQQFNYVGNAFPAQLDIQDIQLDDSAGNFVNNLQLIKSDGTSAAYYVWANKATAKGMKITDGSKGAWIGQDKKPLTSPVILEPGEGVQIDTMNAETIITVLAPIDL